MGSLTMSSLIRKQQLYYGADTCALGSGFATCLKDVAGLKDVTTEQTVYPMIQPVLNNISSRNKI